MGLWLHCCAEIPMSHHTTFHAHTAMTWLSVALWIRDDCAVSELLSEFVEYWQSQAEISTGIWPLCATPQLVAQEITATRERHARQ